ncbi:hypothetical protein AM571_PC00857 (plasmid) [Rhizobium etli 8C-3]|nr:hypothetical protein AM571_PC00857 [Rhizobium etli 8C-3]TCU39360.1 hypothetical protein EV129_103206 [Rhizobium azibense]
MKRPRPPKERITEMQVMIEGQTHFQPLGSDRGFKDLVDYHKFYSHMLMQGSSGLTTFVMTSFSSIP